MSDTHRPSTDDERFLQLVAMFQYAAMQQLGKLVHPGSGEIERDLDQARASIDILEMLERRTAGNLSEPEASFLRKVLFELRMNYVDEMKRGPDENAPESDPAAPESTQ